jgi:hypothetical protein
MRPTRSRVRVARKGRLNVCRELAKVEVPEVLLPTNSRLTTKFVSTE